MQLTEKAIRCQELGADMSSGFGIILHDTERNEFYVYEEGYIKTNSEEIIYNTEHEGGLQYVLKQYCFDEEKYNETYGTYSKGMYGYVLFDEKDLHVIGHPLNRGRLWYLYRASQSKIRKQENAHIFYVSFNKVHDYFMYDISNNLRQQTILDRQHNDELMDAIEEFLLSLQDKG